MGPAALRESDVNCCRLQWWPKARVVKGRIVKIDDDGIMIQHRLLPISQTEPGL